MCNRLFCKRFFCSKKKRCCFYHGVNYVDIRFITKTAAERRRQRTFPLSDPKTLFLLTGERGGGVEHFGPDLSSDSL